MTLLEITDTDFDTIVDGIEALPCEATDFVFGSDKRDPCEESAAWTWLWSCGCVTLYCETHHAKGMSLNPQRGGFLCDVPHAKRIRLISFERL